MSEYKFNHSYSSENSHNIIVPFALLGLYFIYFLIDNIKEYGEFNILKELPVLAIIIGSFLIYFIYLISKQAVYGIKANVPYALETLILIVFGGLGVTFSLLFPIDGWNTFNFVLPFAVSILFSLSGAILIVAPLYWASPLYKKKFVKKLDRFNKNNKENI